MIVEIRTEMKIEKEWEEGEKVRKRSKVMEVEDKNNEGTGNYINEVKDTFPFGCFLCRVSFVDSVVITYAKHYLRENCHLSLWFS
ncbi:unnamed protein product [Eruca vesicaria subsp. sativa]|uniref:Uncharacterized protein n=1 Tax=Eruca vesicaria subsp. sativa TaxID=29727 RepID=A0ABC8LBY6_ERUVS|nr:unnamed protein product [Eruca vesicaria subsp. sativa]